MTSPDRQCPAHKYDCPEERVVGICEPYVAGAWGLVCWSCLDDMLNAEARRKEWELEEDTDTV